MKKLNYIFLFFILIFFKNISFADSLNTNKLAISYANLVSHYYSETVAETNYMLIAIKKFLSDPNEKNLNNAKIRWIKAREVYGITEAFRFYGGPIDGTNQYGEEGPEGLINSWPLNEAYIDYVKGDPSAGIINNLNYDINKTTIIASNQSDDDADVSTGWHAIEFLLWGQDSSLETAGQRQYSDYISNNGNNDRRREYLLKVSELLMEHLIWLDNQWQA